MRSYRRILLLGLSLLLLLSGCGLSEPPAASPPEIEMDHSEPVPVGDAVDDDWFSDTAMIGHSLMCGMELYSGLTTPDYYTLTGASVKELLSSSDVELPSGGTGRLADALEGKTYERFYLFMGINEVAGKLSTLRGHYEQLIDLVQENSPDADVYVLAVMPVTQSKASGGTFTLERITAYNDMLQELCEERGCWYVDLYDCFAGEDGYLPSAASFDGVHLQPGEYATLLDYLKTHTAP